MRRTSKLLVVVSLSLLAVGLAASPVSAFEQAQNPASIDAGTNCECLDSGGGGDDDGGGGGGGELESNLDGTVLFNLDSGGSGGGGDDDDGGGGGGELER
jgi:hypothetical protein